MSFFKKLEELEIIYFKDCYKSCNGHCCNADKPFNVIIPMLKSEYEYIKDKTNLSLVASIAYKLKCEKTITLCFVKCSYKGLCAFRPLACKLYPFFALVNDDGLVLDINAISLYDLFYKDFSSHPCPLIKYDFDNLKAQFLLNVKQISNEPIIIFIFRALELLVKYLKLYLKDLYLDNCENKKEILHTNNFLNAYKNEEFKNEINELYLRLSLKYKDNLDKYL
ncbi:MULTISPECIES: hypothetical protein [unclassified Campylobacter]|uniref:hypothetical protein n=1 Tax=unclassified Campylobacter TaxID=2593542 RepID=UPI001BDB293D|nr:MULTISPECIES: hypothetical protein [unclassified Campylobacter]MBT0879746.1 hypothetical protein [Campylobacter sp. 2018MI27]MBT0884595.1 hypothetical protein [Campylobacter sp. 2018MI10]MBZ7984477.1 hypothetical protein [Campylobacter sp. RM12647]MBZ7993801.1 hypothetical protein [Campylobacter sp. RM9333]